eukprot:scaffold21221_cov60-Phaeocystis_antarctica.AAC.15
MIRGQGGHNLEGGSWARVLRGPRRRHAAETQELRHGVIGAQVGWRDVPDRAAPARRSCEKPLRPERLRAWPATQSRSARVIWIWVMATEGRLPGAKVSPSLYWGSRLREEQCGEGASYRWGCELG